MTISRLRPRTGLLALAALCAITVVAVLAAPSAHAGRTIRSTRCDISAVSTTLGPTSVSSLKVAGGVTCARGISVVRAFHQCRLANGVSGRCVRLVKGYACREQRTTGPTQFSARATCTKGRRTVAHSYTQSL